MKLLILTQTVNKNDPALGFVPSWLDEFSRHFDSIEVVCLKEGEHDSLPKVAVHSLGKEHNVSRFTYIWRFYKYALWTLLGRYDVVFVHMNQEYVLLGGIFWKILGKRVFMWRNHYAGGKLTDLAAMFCTKILCTSKYSYTMKYKKTVLMPIGVDTDVFKSKGTPTSSSILSLGRIAPSKRLEILVDALAQLRKRNVTFSATIQGEASPEDASYKVAIQKRINDAGLQEVVTLRSGLLHDSTPTFYSQNEIFVNCSRSGMYDKTIFEAAACGVLSVASSLDYAEIAPPELVFKDGDAHDLAAKIEHLLAIQSSERERIQRELRVLVEKNSLRELGQHLAAQVH